MEKVKLEVGWLPLAHKYAEASHGGPKTQGRDTPTTGESWPCCLFTAS